MTFEPDTRDLPRDKHEAEAEDEVQAAYLERVVDLIAQYGVAIQSVGGDETEPGFAYTVGLARVERPEVIVFGLPGQVAQRVLNHVSSKVFEEGLVLRPGEERDDILRGYPARFMTVLPGHSEKYLRVSNALFAGATPVHALQLVFTDADGRWPWDADSGVAVMSIIGGVACRVCGESVHPVEGEWVHHHGDGYCHTGDGAMADPRWLS